MEEPQYKYAKAEIQKTNSQIDDRVYKIYGITEAEKKSVEGAVT